MFGAISSFVSRQLPTVARLLDTSSLTTLAVPDRGAKMGRLHWPNWKALRDFNRRKILENYGFERRNLTVMKKNDILPAELQAVAHEQILTQPKSASITYTTNRCIYTSRGKRYGNQRRWRASRIMFRHFADYNLISGVQRGQWA